MANASLPPAPVQNPLQGRILRLRAVVDGIGISKTTIYTLIRQGKFPKPVRLGARAVGWRESEVREWAASRSSAA